MTGTLFESIPPVTVRRWVCKLGKCLVPCTPLERTYLKNQGFSKFGYLISEDDLRALIHYSKIRRPYKKRASQRTTDHTLNSDDSNNVPSSIATSASVVVDQTENEIARETQLQRTTDHTLNSSDSNYVPSSIATSASVVVDQTENEIARETQLQRTTDHTLNSDDSNNVPSSIATSASVVVDQTENEIACGTQLQRTTDHTLNSSDSNNVPSSIATSASVVVDQTENEIARETQLQRTTDHTLNSSDSNNVPSSIATSASVVVDQTENEIARETQLQRTTDHTLNSDDSMPVQCKIGCLKREDTSAELQLKLDQLSEFYTSSVNPLRKCGAFSPSTVNKFLERVKCFLNFCRLKYPQQKLDFSIVDDVDIVQSYITYQLEERQLNISTVVRTIIALINLCKFVHRRSENLDSCVHLVRLKNIQNQLSQRQHSYQLAAKAGLCADKSPSFMFRHILDTIKSLKEKVDCSKEKPGHVRMLHDFIMIALYVTSMCGRSKEVRTLELFDESLESQEFEFDWRRRCNVFVVSADENEFTLYENDFKNVKTRGPSKFQMDNSMWLIPYVKEYVRKRQDLLCGKSHPYIFMTTTGLPFSSSSFTAYLSSLFQREVNIRAGTTKLRHALVTHVLSLPEAESLRLRESLAELMRHSLKHQ